MAHEAVTEAPGVGQGLRKDSCAAAAESYLSKVGVECWPGCLGWLQSVCLKT